MKIRYLGTAAFEGTPAMYCNCRICSHARQQPGRNVRTRSQAVINSDLLIDYPPDTYFHTLHMGLDLRTIQNILITHSHSDHFYPEDLDHNRFPCAVKEAFHTVCVYGNQKVMGLLSELYGDGAHNHLQFSKAEVFEPFTAGKYKITPLPALHDPGEACLLYLIEFQGKRLLYGNDTGFLNQACMDWIRGQQLDLISLDCTQGKHRDGNNHMGYLDVIQQLDRFWDNGNVGTDTIKVAQHFSHYGDVLYEEYLDLFSSYGIITAYDGLELEV